MVSFWQKQEARLRMRTLTQLRKERDKHEADAYRSKQMVELTTRILVEKSHQERASDPSRIKGA